MLAATIITMYDYLKLSSTLPKRAWTDSIIFQAQVLFPSSRLIKRLAIVSSQIITLIRLADMIQTTI